MKTLSDYDRGSGPKYILGPVQTTVCIKSRAIKKNIFCRHASVFKIRPNRRNFILIRFTIITRYEDFYHLTGHIKFNSGFGTFFKY